MTILIFTNKGLAQDYAVLIHEWLIKNRKGYKADRWCDIDSCVDKTETKWFIKVPPDYETLNTRITKIQDRLSLPKTGIEIVDKIPEDWRPDEKDIINIINN